MKRKTVLHILRSSEYAGAEKIAVTIIKELGKEYDMVYLASDGPVREKLEQEHIRYILLPQYSRQAIRQAVRNVRPDIVHAHDFTATVMAASLKGKFYLISHLHNDPPWVRKWNPGTALFALLLGRVDRLIVVSDSAYGHYIFKRKCRKKVQIIRNPVDLDEIRLLAGNAGGQKQYDLLFCGRMSEQKNPEGFIDIVWQLKKEGIPVRAVMLGRGPLLEPCRSLVRNRRLEENIEMKGFVDNPYRYMAQSRILCMPSRWEGFGLAAAEASVLGVPVLATRAVGLLERNGKDAYEYCDTTSEFCAKIKELLGDAALYAKRKDASLKNAGRLADTSRYAEAVRNVYQEAVCRRSRR